MKASRFAGVMACTFSLILSQLCFGLPNPHDAQSFGSAFFVSSNGLLLTADHVIEDEGTVIVVHDGKSYRAEVLQRDSTNDLAVLKIQARDTPFLEISSPSKISIGLDVLASGFPNPLLQGHDVKLTDGLISCLKGFRGASNQIQTTAAIQPGNSGGPLVNRNTGEVVGVIVSELRRFPVDGRVPQNVNYATNISLAVPLLNTCRLISSASCGSEPVKRLIDSTAQVLVMPEGYVVEGGGPANRFSDELEEFIHHYFRCRDRYQMYEPVLERYFNEINIDRSAVLASQKQHIEHWPHREFDVQSCHVSKLGSGQYHALVKYTYELKNGNKERAGYTTALFKVRRSNRSFKIGSIIAESTPRVPVDKILRIQRPFRSVPPQRTGT